MKLTEFLDMIESTHLYSDASDIWDWTAPDGTEYHYISDEDAFEALKELNEMIKAGRFEDVKR